MNLSTQEADLLLKTEQYSRVSHLFILKEHSKGAHSSWGKNQIRPQRDQRGTQKVRGKVLKQRWVSDDTVESLENK